MCIVFRNGRLLPLQEGFEQRRRDDGRGMRVEEEPLYSRFCLCYNASLMERWTSGFERRFRCKFEQDFNGSQRMLVVCNTQKGSAKWAWKFQGWRIVCQ